MLRQIFDDMNFLGRTIYKILPDVNISGISNGETTPSVNGKNLITLASTAPVNITNFKDGASGQHIRILGDGNSTVINGTNIFTNTGADKLLAANRVYRFSLIDDIWYEDA